MIPLVPALLAGAAGYLAYKAIKKEMNRVARDLKQAEERETNIPTLERDPETGIYRPRDDGF